MTGEEALISGDLEWRHSPFPFPGRWLAQPFESDSRGRAVVAADGPNDDPWALLVVDRATGEVFHVDVGSETDERIAASLGALADLMAVTRLAVTRAEDESVAEEAANDLAAHIGVLDAELVSDEDSFWSVVVEQIGDGLLGGDPDEDREVSADEEEEEAFVAPPQDEDGVTYWADGSRQRNPGPSVVLVVWPSISVELWREWGVRESDIPPWGDLLGRDLLEHARIIGRNQAATPSLARTDILVTRPGSEALTPRLFELLPNVRRVIRVAQPDAPTDAVPDGVQVIHHGTMAQAVAELVGIRDDEGVNWRAPYRAPRF